MNRPPLIFEQVDAVVLAGGQGSRVGYQQKALLEYQGRPLLNWILERLSPQVSQVWISANQELATYQLYTPRVFPDNQQGFLGPLEGMASAWLAIEQDWCVFVPCDNPNLPTDLVSRFCHVAQQTNRPIIVVHDGERIQPLYCMIHRSMLISMRSAVARDHLSVRRWIIENPHALVDCSDIKASGFQNLNSLEGLENVSV